MHSQNAFIQAPSLAKLFRHTDNFFGVLMILHTILWLMQNMHSDNLYLPAASAVVPTVPLLVLFQPALWPKWQMPREGDWGWNGCSTGWNNLELRKSHTFSSFCPATIHSEFQAQKSPTLLLAPAEDAHCWKEQISSNNMAEFLNIPTTSNISGLSRFMTGLLIFRLSVLQFVCAHLEHLHQNIQKSWLVGMQKIRITHARDNFCQARCGTTKKTRESSNNPSKTDMRRCSPAFGNSLEAMCETCDPPWPSKTAKSASQSKSNRAMQPLLA